MNKFFGNQFFSFFRKQLIQKRINKMNIFFQDFYYFFRNFGGSFRPGVLLQLHQMLFDNPALICIIIKFSHTNNIVSKHKGVRRISLRGAEGAISFISLLMRRMEKLFMSRAWQQFFANGPTRPSTHNFAYWINYALKQ